MIPLKNIDVVLFALAQLTSEFDWTYTVIGDGPQRAALESMISDLGLEDRVSLLGRRSRDEVIKLMDDASIFVMPSAPESMGMAYLEAMARGCIVVGAVGWGIDGVVHDGINGFLLLREMWSRVLRLFKGHSTLIFQFENQAWKQ